MARDESAPTGAPPRTREGGPDLAHLERQLGDVLVEGEIARTPRAAVYRIRVGTMAGHALALKVALQPGTTEDLAQFRHEVRLLSEVRHPNVIEVHDFGVLPGDFPFLTMELLPPSDLAAELAGGGWDAFFDVAMQAAAGLAHIHRHGVVHLDVKPSNLGLVRRAPDPPLLKILDFGLAQSVRGPLDRRIRGTLAYAAPEILLQDAYDQRADLYSLGMTLYQLATGVLPSAGDDMTAIRFHLEGAAPDPAQHRPDLPPALGAILARLLQRDPQRRFSSAARLLAELGRAAGRQVDTTALALGEGTLLASRMVAREEALGRLRQALQAAGAGRGATLLVEGAEGSGKSRLLREFRLLAAVDGARVAVGRSVAGRNQPLQLVVEALRRLGIEPVAGAGRAPRWGEEVERFQLYRRIAAQLAEHARPAAALVLVLDDLQAAERETQELVAFLAAEVVALPVLVVGARRPPAPEERGDGDLLAAPEIETLPLPPLDRRHTQEVVDASLGAERLPEAIYEWVHQQSAGYPGRVGSLLRHLVTERVLRYRDGEWKPALQALARLASTPGAVEELERQRLQALPEPQRRVLEAAAVVGEPFPIEALAELLGEPAASVYERAAELVAQGFLERQPESDGARYLFAQTATREALYGALAGDRRRELHAALAAQLERRLLAGEAALAGAVTEHFWRAGERARALPYALQAAAAAAAVHGHAEAALLYGRAAEAAAEAGDAESALAARARQAESLGSAGQYPRALRLCLDLLQGDALQGRRAEDRRLRATLWLRAGRLHARLGEHDAARDCFESGLGQLADSPDAEIRIELLHGKAWALKDLGEADAAFGAARSALREAGERGLHAQRANLLNTLGMLYYSQGDWRRAGRLVRRGLRAAQVANDAQMITKLRNNLGNVLWKNGDYAAAGEHYRQNLEFCERTNDLWGQLTALNNLGILECARGHWQAARAPLSRSLELKRRLRVREAEALARLNLGEVEEVLGEWSRARRHYERALKCLADAPQHGDRISALAQLASLARKRGAHGEADTLARQALAAAEQAGDRDLLAGCHLQLGLVEKDREQWASAASHLERALALAEAADTREALPRLHNSLADLALRRGERETAERHAQAARAWVDRLGDQLELGKLLSIEARLALLRDAPEAADALFAEGVRTLEEVQAPFEYGRSLYEWGIRTTNAEAAAERLGLALSAFERLGAAAEAERARGVLEQARERLRLGGGRRGLPGLYEVVKVINTSLDLEEVLARTMDLVLERLRAERGMIVFCDQLTGDLQIAAARNFGADGGREGRDISESVVRRVIERREPVLAVDALTDQRFVGAESIVASHIVSILCVPVAIRDRLVGAIYLDHCTSRHLFGEKDLEFLRAFADQAAIAIDNARLYATVESSRQRLKAENEALRREILSSRHLGALIGKSRAIAELKHAIERVAQSNSTVLIRGESGTGKGLVARILHAVSSRREGPFIQFNCAALPETLVESELFGHEKGAFTGAAGMKPGRFELAHGGTVFLDEIGKVSRGVQAKLLRVVEDKEFERVGGTKTLRADVRIISATNLNLEEAIAHGEFREDLYYRLNIIPIVLPPLRERKQDIPYLVQHFLAKISRDLGLPEKQLDPPVLDLFLRHRWPGNVRELEATIHRALVLSPEDPLRVADFGWIAQAVNGEGGEGGAAAAGPVVNLGDGDYQVTLERVDRQLITQALDRAGGRIREAARLLGIARNTLKAKMKRYNLAGAE